MIDKKLNKSAQLPKWAHLRFGSNVTPSQLILDGQLYLLGRTIAYDYSINWASLRSFLTHKTHDIYKHVDIIVHNKRCYLHKKQFGIWVDQYKLKTGVTLQKVEKIKRRRDTCKK